MAHPTSNHRDDDDEPLPPSAAFRRRHTAIMSLMVSFCLIEQNETDSCHVMLIICVLLCEQHTNTYTSATMTSSRTSIPQRF